jgi:tetratricopeptide (TPR) repeat protein
MHIVLFFLFGCLGVLPVGTVGEETKVQVPAPAAAVPQPAASETDADTCIKEAEALMDKGQYAEALAAFRKALGVRPDDPALQYNGGLAAYLAGEFTTAAELWERLRKADPADWQVRAKLVQAYQALGKLDARDVARKELFALRASGADAELAEQAFYCRDQFETAGQRVMVFEHFELKGDRAVRYAFVVLGADGEEEFHISLGSYESTNRFWRQTTQPPPDEGQRLFHLDGYYSWGHATYGFYSPEPSYDDVRAAVEKILRKESKPVSKSVVQPKKP